MAARDVLDRDGPLAPAELGERLARSGVHLNEGLIARLPSMFPATFTGSDGRIASARAARPLPVDEDDDDGDETPGESGWWNRPPDVPRLREDRVWVIDIETTGFDRDHDHVWEIGLVNFATGASVQVRIEIPEGVEIPLAGPDDADAEALPAPDAIDEAIRALGEAEALLGHNLDGFDIPFLRAFAARHGRVWPDLPTLDLHTLSLLVEPTLTNRRLADLCERYGVMNTAAHRATADAEATAEIARTLIAMLRPHDQNHALAIACLRRGGHPWAQLLPQPGPIGDLRDALRPADDPLASESAGPAPGSGRDGARVGFEVLLSAGLAERRSQRGMADEVAAVLDDGGHLAVEAPTGTGKSFAYLIPALARAAASGRPVVVATHTKVLQRQLRDDARRLRDLGLLHAPFRQLQGVENYICTREIARVLENGDDAGADAWLAVAVAVRALEAAETGVWDEVTDHVLGARRADYRIARDGLRTSTNDCDRRDCEWRSRCPLMGRMPDQDETPGVLSVNHAVVAGWLAAQEAGGRAPSDALGEDRAELVFDEAHTLEDSLASAWTETVSGAGIAVLMRRLRARAGPLRLARRALRAAGMAFREPEGLRSARATWLSLCEAVGQAATVYLHEYGRDARSIAINGPVASRRREYRHLVAAIDELRRSLTGALAGLAEISRLLTQAGGGAGAARRRVWALRRDLGVLVTRLENHGRLDQANLFVYQLTLQDSDGSAALRWGLERTPIEVGPRFARQVMEPARTVVLTSATLSIRGSFAFLASRLGLRLRDEDDPAGTVRTLQLPSPFDIPRQARLILTSHLSLPVPASEDAFCEEMAADQVGFLSLSGGRALTLFASRSRMTRVADLVDEYAAPLRDRGVELLVQGRERPDEIRRRFRDEPGTCAYGVRSYWEGFDAPGPTLSYLFIEKPPYPHPDDPLAAARQRVIADRGGDPFMEYAVPSAAIALAQGFGRLIRNEADRGAAFTLDRRLQLPTDANTMLLGALPEGLEPVFADSREDAWREALRFVTGSEPDIDAAIAAAGSDVEALLEGLRLCEGEDPEEKLRRAAAELFGIAEVKPEQMDLMTAILTDRDVVGLLPTGFGKSLCFQLPALLRADRLPTVVISPLIALIKDQVDELRGRRRLREVFGLIGATSGAERTDVARRLAEGQVRLLYVSPERLANDPTLRVALSEQGRLGSLVIDEAHCISSWGHAFRPEFRRIATAVADLPRSARAAFTATATPAVEEEIRSALQLTDPLVVRAGIDRPNLRYRVQWFHTDDDRARELLRLTLAWPDVPGIVYASRRATTEELAYLLRQAGIRARAYHGAMVPEQREAVQNEFLDGTLQVIVATKAFGMGIDKPDIGWVVHYDLPESLEAYAQEAGRAGRSPGMTGDCVLFVTKADMARRRRQAGRPDPALGPDTARRLLDLVRSAPVRGGRHILDPVAACQQLDLDDDQLNTLVARLEDVGCVTRHHDCVVRGKLQTGSREPADEQERRDFRETVRVRLGVRLGVGRLVDFTAHDDADQLEERLSRWAIQRYVTFWATARHWRVTVLRDEVPTGRLETLTTRWAAVQRRQLDAMIAYAELPSCRRAALRAHFGESPITCAHLGGQACDACSGAAPRWHGLPRDQVPDPESLIDVELVILQAVAWSRRFEQGRYAASGLKFALLGNETFPGGRSLGRGLLACPQFGALEHLASAERRYDDAVRGLVSKGAIVVERASGREREYDTLDITPAGQAVLTGAGVTL